MERRAHRFLVPTLIVAATLLAFVGAFAVWVNRQALDTDNWAGTSEKLLANDEITDALSPYLVNQLFTKVDVAAALEARLPDRADPLAAPAAAGLKEIANRAAPRLLTSPAAQGAWVAANRAAHKQLITVVNGGSGAVSTDNGEVVLNLRSLVDQLATSLGVTKQVAAARTKAQAAVTLPADTGHLVIMKSDELGAAQDVAHGVKGLAIVLPLLAIALFALAVWFARGRRRLALRTAGWCFVGVGVALLLIRRVGGNEIVDALVKVPANEPAVHNVWEIATSLLAAIAVAMIVYGIVIVLSAWLAGPTRLAALLRKSLAPTLRDSPVVAYAAVLGVLLLVVAWGPTPAFRKLLTILLFAGLLALGVAMLRRQTALEFPGVRKGDAWRDVRGSTDAGGSPAPGRAYATRLEGLERLVALHNSGELTDEEFAAEKARLANGT